MTDLTEVARDEVPRYPQRVYDEEVAEEVISEAAVGEFFDIGRVETNTVGADVFGYRAMDVGMEKFAAIVERVEPDLRKRNTSKYEDIKLPSNKVDYMRMSVAEKVRCYPFDIEGTDLAFEMVKTYFETVGLETDFHTVYEEAKLLTDFYEERKAEEFLQERVEQIIGTMELIKIDADRLTAYSADVLSEVFGFGDMEYFTGIKLFNKVIDELRVDMDQQRRYEMFDRIYAERMKKRDYEYNSYIR